MAKTKETVTMRPSELASELDIDPKTLRSWLRSNFTRDAEAKNTSWVLTPKMVKAATDHFTASDEEDDEADES